jgi:hypothetical protein
MLSFVHENIIEGVVGWMGFAKCECKDVRDWIQMLPEQCRDRLEMSRRIRGIIQHICRRLDVVSMSLYIICRSVYNAPKNKDEVVALIDKHMQRFVYSIEWIERADPGFQFHEM